jgi:UDPglucose--hexose-1-phosphate uridylyltransferase
MSELRFHPFLNQWVITATHRQDRTFLPPDDYCPLCPTLPGGFPTEIPDGHYDIVVFPNKFPSLVIPPSAPAIDGTELLPVRPSAGVCEVVCYSQVHDSTFALLPYSQVRKLTRVWKERYVTLGAHPEVEYVFIFENKGKEIGVTLSHPHGQIYAYPFIPPIAAIETNSERTFFAAEQRPLMEAVLAENGSTVVYENDWFVAFIPLFARYPYETYVAPKTHMASLAQMDGAALDDLADALLTVTRKLDGLFGFSMPYIMAMHQSPTCSGVGGSGDGDAGYEESSWFHVEFYPPYRTANKLKYLAGSEAGVGAFINDTLPEETSKLMRAVEIARVR